MPFVRAGWDARLLPATTRRAAQTEILDGSGGGAATTVAWLKSYVGAVVTTVAPPAVRVSPSSSARISPRGAFPPPPRR